MGFHTFNPQWQFTLGLRWDHFDSDYQYDYADPSLHLQAVNEEMSWSAGIVYKPADNGTIYFGSGTSFSPSAEDLMASTNGNNATLDPEESIGFELGTKWEFFDGRLLANAALFRTDKSNARTDDPFVDDNIETLNGEQRVDGLELSAMGQLTEQLSLMASYTLQDSEVVKAEGDDTALVGYELPRTPRHSSSFWGRYEFSERWTAGVGMQYVGDRYNSSDPGGREFVEGFHIYDLMISVQASDVLQLQLNGTNLTDENYASQIGGGHFVPGEGRTYSLSAFLSF